MRGQPFRASVILAALVIVGWQPLPAAGAAYIKIAGVDGEATSAYYEGWSELGGFEFFVGSGAQDSRFSGLRIAKPLDKASPLLYQALADGHPLPRMIIEVTRPDQGRQLRWWRMALEEVFVSQVDLSGDQTGGGETLTLRFAKITIEYSHYDFSGVLTGNQAMTWDQLREVAETLPSPILRMEGARNENGGMLLQWPARIGARYRVLASRHLDGPYQLIRIIEAEEHGTLSEVIATSDPAGFIVVEEVP
jgi:type VI protein secretion system component Hcp